MFANAGIWIVVFQAQHLFQPSNSFIDIFHRAQKKVSKKYLKTVQALEKKFVTLSEMEDRCKNPLTHFNSLTIIKLKLTVLCFRLLYQSRASYDLCL